MAFGGGSSRWLLEPRFAVQALPVPQLDDLETLVIRAHAVDWAASHGRPFPGHPEPQVSAGGSLEGYHHSYWVPRTGERQSPHPIRVAQRGEPVLGSKLCGARHGPTNLELPTTTHEVADEQPPPA